MKKIYFSILFFLFAMSLKAQWTADTMLNTTVRDSNGTNEATPLSVTTNNGSTYISWFESYNGNYQLRMQLLDAAGNKQWAEEGLIVSDYPQSSALYRYDLQADHDGNAIVAFQDIRTGGNLNIVAYLISASGNFLWGAAGISLSDDVSTQGLGPVIGVTASNNIVIGWNASAGSLQWVACQKISQAGNLMWGSSTLRVIDSSNVKKYTRPSFVAARTDDFLMLYVQQTGSFPYTNTMFVQRYDATGDGVWPSSIQFSTKTISFFFFPKGVSDLNGGMYVGFNTSNPVSTSLNDVYVQHIDADGNLWSATGTEAAISTTTHKTTPALKYLASRYEVWVLLKVQDSGQGMSGISVQKFDTSGSVLLNTNGVTVLPVSNDYNDPADFENVSNGIIIVFTKNSGPTAKILKALKVDYNAASLWTSGEVTISSVSSAKLRINAEAIFNEVVVVWEDQRIDQGVYAQNVHDDGSIGPLGLPNVIRSAASFTLFPNPANHLPVMLLDEKFEGDVSIQLTDVIGNTILSKNIFIHPSIRQIDLSKLVGQDLRAGIYFVGVTNKYSKEIKKMVKE